LKGLQTQFKFQSAVGSTKCSTSIGLGDQLQSIAISNLVFDIERLKSTQI
jgi:hypothetical protein